MSSRPFRVSVFENKELVYERDFGEKVEVGRQVAAQGEEGPCYSRPVEGSGVDGAAWRMVIAATEEADYYSRKHLTLTPSPDGTVTVKNLSGHLSILLPNDPECSELAAGCSRVIPLQPPARLTVGTKTLVLRLAPDAPQSLNQAATKTFDRFEATVVRLKEVINLLQSAVSSQDFFDKAAQAIINLVGMDSGRVLTLDKDHRKWEERALKVRPDRQREDDWKASRHVLWRVRDERQTFWQMPYLDFESQNRFNIKAIVASPILGEGQKVIGALYGDTRTILGRRPPIDNLDTTLMDLLACAVGARLALLRERHQFEQFFTRELAEQLTLQPDLLEGQHRVVTVLFSDIRGFSRISEVFGARRIVDLVADVMNTLSECVLRHKGVLVDYIGDALLAMWGAPQPQLDHARLACCAAIDMLRALPSLNNRWGPTLTENKLPLLDIGIGLNTGWAHVGNTGSHRKFKYGPLGDTVNVASRVQGITKHVGSRLLITGATQGHLGNEFDSRRLGEVRVVNRGEPVTLFELALPFQERWPELKAGYEKAYQDFAAGNFRAVIQTLAGLVASPLEDGPSLALMNRAIQALGEGAPESLVWDLKNK
jgi:adenylate cyclase